MVAVEDELKPGYADEKFIQIDLRLTTISYMSYRSLDCQSQANTEILNQINTIEIQM